MEWFQKTVGLSPEIQGKILLSILTIYTSVKDGGVLLTIRYLCEPRRRCDSEQGIWEDILKGFSKYENIDFAYPTQRSNPTQASRINKERKRSHEY